MNTENFEINDVLIDEENDLKTNGIIELNFPK